jgi:hypothetical protein
LFNGINNPRNLFNKTKALFMRNRVKIIEIKKERVDMKNKLLRFFACLILIALSVQSISVEAQSFTTQYALPSGDLGDSDFDVSSERVFVPPSEESLRLTQEQVQAFDCATVTDAPKSECEALVAVYESTNGAGWKDNTN